MNNLGAELLRTGQRCPPGRQHGARAEGAEATALDLAGALGAVPLDETTPCPARRVVVPWTEPDAGQTRGAYVEPLGPRPTRSTHVANGTVACAGSSYGLAGFTATWSGRRWSVAFVPELGEGDRQPSSTTGDASRLPSTRWPCSIGDPSTWGGRSGPEIEPLAAYEPRRVCLAGAQPGTAAFRTLVLQALPSSTDLGMARGCDVGRLSEHKEGRAWDWGVRVDRADGEVISWLFGTDEYGNRFAMARRLGVTS